ncbi:type II toxin-antitoxin system RelE/ParE family toxin [Oleomonas cavernae]|uniref:Type II toxin-antitoxin system RelE/ParE family toxin n=1 Tax=Oleomonas cavernae TaxID=2320859 RepID=A0A418WFY3_9PROT|nr:type II toxin-antitoxin system RelE/ParE family toxin [Oleomonas cavernae]
MTRKPKDAIFRGDSLERLIAFPKPARASLGHNLDRVQVGEEPEDWKAMTGIGEGVYELRARVDKQAYRVAYIARFAEAIYVLHAFEKKTQKTSPKDKSLIEQRFADLVRERKEKGIDR